MNFFFAYLQISKDLWLIIAFVLSFCLDRWLSDPQTTLHPVRWFGVWISFFEFLLNRFHKLFRLLMGALFVLFSISLLLFLFSKINIYLKKSSSFGFVLWNVFFIYFFLAGESLIRESKKVWLSLSIDIVTARKSLSYIVGRQTQNLNEQEIRRAVLETLSENLSDAVVAPLFYFLFGGTPLMAVYKLVNTLDSMIGYKNDRFLYFGKTAARLDDILNFIPARITAFLILWLSKNLKNWQLVQHYAKKHESVNAGYPEAALAIALSIRLGGPAVYFGKEKKKAWLGKNPRNIVEEDFFKAVRYNRETSYFMFFFVVAKMLFLVVLSWLFHF